MDAPGKHRTDGTFSREEVLYTDVKLLNKHDLERFRNLVFQKSSVSEIQCFRSAVDGLMFPEGVYQLDPAAILPAPCLTPRCPCKRRKHLNMTSHLST